MKNPDRTGLDYDELLEIQKEHLAEWKLVLTPEAHASTVRLCEQMNHPATDPAHGRHCVPRGSELADLILNFPKHADILLSASLE